MKNIPNIPKTIPPVPPIPKKPKLYPYPSLEDIQKIYNIPSIAKYCKHSTYSKDFLENIRNMYLNKHKIVKTIESTDGGMYRVEYRYENKTHNTEGPAVILKSGTGIINATHYYLNNILYIKPEYYKILLLAGIIRYEDYFLICLEECLEE